MQKSIFFKILITFVLIIVFSFTILSWIFTTMILGYSSDKQDSQLLDSTVTIARQIEAASVVSMTECIATGGTTSESILSIVAVFPEMDMLLCDEDGVILYRAQQDGAQTEGVIDLTKLTPLAQRPHSYSYGGTVDEGTPQHIFATAVYIGDRCIGYVLAVRLVKFADPLIGVVNSATFTSSIWVILAAVIAVYFITERMTRPLRDITHTSKLYAKGDFSTRVRIYGNDEIGELAHAFNHMADELQKLDHMRNSFLANVSHDLRTPMTTISGFIDGICSGAIPEEKHAHYLNVISVEVHRLSRLVGELLDVSRLESGERKFVFSDFDVAEMARIILISFEQRIEEKRLSVVFDSQDSVIAFADKDAIHQVLYNLCHNAIKFASDGGELCIQLCEEEQAITVRIFDEGQPISEEEIPYVFDRFYKADKSRGLDKTGVGLGLYISKTIIDAHKESISVQTTEHEGRVGCEFTFTLKRGTAPTRKLPPIDA